MVHAIRAGAGFPLLAALLGLAVLAAAQPIRIPDFREGQAEPVAIRPGDTCANCGSIRSIREIQSTRPIPVPQAIHNDPIDRGMGSDIRIGAVVALPMGEGSKPYVGGVGTPEMRERFAETTYDITIRLDNGAFTNVQRADGGRYQVGDRVRVKGTQMELITP
jgi:outer membrane lipoprotein SlyB